jgi:hypothetical protein
MGIAAQCLRHSGIPKSVVKQLKEGLVPVHRIPKGLFRSRLLLDRSGFPPKNRLQQQLGQCAVQNAATKREE